MLSLPVPLQRAAERGLRVAALASFVAPLLTRLVIGQAFFLTGRGKIANFDNTVAFFTELGIPMPELNAAFVSRLEYWGGIALILGLLTRLFALGLLSTMAVALATADREQFVTAFDTASDIGFTDVTPLVYGLFLLWLVLFGPGAVSLDRLLWRGKARAEERRRAAA